MHAYVSMAHSHVHHARPAWQRRGRGAQQSTGTPSVEKIMPVVGS